MKVQLQFSFHAISSLSWCRRSCNIIRSLPRGQTPRHSHLTSNLGTHAELWPAVEPQRTRGESLRLLQFCTDQPLIFRKYFHSERHRAARERQPNPRYAFWSCGRKLDHSGPPLSPPSLHRANLVSRGKNGRLMHQRVGT